MRRSEQPLKYVRPLCDLLVREKKLDALRRSRPPAGPRRRHERRRSRVEEDHRASLLVGRVEGSCAQRRARRLKVDKARAQKIVTLLLRDKSADQDFRGTGVSPVGARASAQPDGRVQGEDCDGGVAKIDVAKFKEMTGVSRKYAIPLLEYLDRERVTRRVGDERVIL